MRMWNEIWEAAAGDDKQTFMASNITETRKFNIKTPDIMIKVNPDRMDLVETRFIDGRKCLVIAVDEYVEINGVNVHTIRGAEDIEE